MREIVISFDENSNAKFLYSDATKAMFPSAAQARRASHVTPAGIAEYWLFRALRGAFGEDGKVGNWTRTWKGMWQLDMQPAGGPSGLVFETRDEAIDYEIQWLNENFL